MSQTRRSFLAHGLGISSVAALGTGVFPFFATAQELQSANDDGLIWHSKQYVTAETALSQLNTWITPTASFFIRNNLLMPSIDLDQWRLHVTGEVEHPLELSFRELQALRYVDVTNTLECAGNGRAFFEPKIDGLRWGRGAVGNAIFSGPPLHALLEKARPKAGARHVAFKGMDVVPSDTNDFIRSIPLDKALDLHTLVALRMNRAPLTAEHGYPARALVPGWIGSCSIKWLTEIRVLKNEFDGFYMRSAYRVTGPQASEDAKPIESLHVKSIITSVAPLRARSRAFTPSQDQNSALAEYTVSNREPIRIQGAAWAGENAIAKVEISTDGSRFWRAATLGNERSPYAWRLWSFDWNPARLGTFALQARATDSRGHVQPVKPPWNPGGYMWNGVDEVRIRVEP
jgi:sulfite oxidase